MRAFDRGDFREMLARVSGEGQLAQVLYLGSWQRPVSVGLKNVGQQFRHLPATESHTVPIAEMLAALGSDKPAG